MNLRQTSFAAGELDPLMWGRTDSALFRHGVRRLRDFFVSQAGNAMTRPGTRYLGAAADSTTGSWLLPFVVSDADGYVIEFSWSGAVQAWRNGAVVWTGTAPFVVAGARAPGAIQFTQSGDLMTIANRGRVYELRRTSETTFAFSVMSFGRAAPQFVALPATTKTTVPGIINAGNLTVATATSPVRKWRWWVSTVLRDSNGRTFESAALEVTEMLSPGIGVYGGSAALGPDRPVTITRRTSGVGTMWAGSVTYETKGYNWYRGVGDYSGFIGHTTTELDFIDDGTEPDYSLPHPREVDPFSLPGGVTDYPSSVAYFENRLTFGGTLYRPASVLLSETDNYIGWQVPAVVVPSQSLEVELAVRKRERVRSLAALQRLLVLTDAGVWALGGAGPLTPTTLMARLVSEVGSAAMRPVMVGSDLLYVRSKGWGLRLVRQSENAEGLFGSIDVSQHAQHLFKNIDTTGSIAVDPLNGVGPITDWCWQEDPWNLVWAVRADGKLISLQWDGQLAGYSLHETGATSGDRFEAVCSIPEGEEDVVYLCVQRNGRYNIERFATRVRRGTVDDDCAVDCARQFTVSVGSPVITVAAGIANGRQVMAVAKDNAPIGPVTVVSGVADFAAAGWKFPTANDGTEVTGWVGLVYQPELETLDVVSSDSRMLQKTVEKVAVEVAESAGFSVGQNPAELVPWKQRDATSGYGFPSAASAVAVVNVKGGWDNGARVTLKQTLPLPLTVLGITRKVAGGG